VAVDLAAPDSPGAISLMTLEYQLRRALIALCGVAAVVGAAGITEEHVFHQASWLKYAVTIVGPLVLAALVVVGNPLALLTALLIVAAPFAGFSMTLQGIHVPLLAPIILCAGAVAAVSEGGVARHRSALLSASVLFLILLILPVAESPSRTDVVATLISLFAAAYFASRLARTEHGFVMLAWAFVASAGFQAAIAVWESETGHRLNLYGAAGSQTLGPSYFFNYGSQARPPGAFYDPDSLGNVLAITLPINVGLGVHYAMRRRWREVAIAVAALALIGVALEITLSRMSWIGAAVGLIVIIVLVPQVRWRALPVLAVAAITLIGLGVFGQQSTTIQRLSSITHPLNETGTANGDVVRVELWRDALDIAEQHPVAGVGLGEVANLLSARLEVAGTSAQGGNAQSVYLQLLAEGGLLAVCGLTAVLLAVTRDLMRTIRAERLWGAVLAGASAAMLICWLTDVTIRYSGVAVLMGVLFGMVAGRSSAAREVAAA
jgi:hypothetical protein